MKKLNSILLCTIFLFSSIQVAASIFSSDKSFLISQDTIEALILLKSNKNDFSPIKKYWGKNKKGTFVYNELSRKADESQKPIKSWLIENGIQFESLYIVNLIKVKATYAELQIIRKRSEVKKVIPNYSMKNPDLIDNRRADLRGPPNLEWGIERIQANKVWELGITGEGVILGGQDTGVNWEHSTLKTKYRGYNNQTGNTNHNYNWHDAIHEINPLNEDTVVTETTNPCGLNAEFPCDDDFHGTWTMGTMVGSDEENNIGVAPGAQWIAVRNMDRGWGTLYTYLEAFQWFLAPTDLKGQSPNPSLAPHVINNSWSCPEEEGCSPDLFPILEEAIENLISAGIVVVVSAGNNGRDGCHTVNAPSAIYENVLTVGATTIEDEVAAYSSRGPVNVDNSFRVKPNVVAPGSSIRSASKGQEFKTASGTSGSSPHVSGTIALMISANPELSGNVNLIRQILIDTAEPLEDDLDCGPFNNNDLPNNTYGFGRINAYSAVLTALNLEAYLEEQQFRIYPNPFQYEITIDLPVDKIVEKILVWNVNGQLIQEIPIGFKVDRKQMVISTQHYHKGFYFYQIIGENWKQTGKLIKL